MCAAVLQVPRIAGRDLAGRGVQLPTDLPRDPAVFVAGFTEGQQRDIDAWGQALPGVEVLEVVLIPTEQERRRRTIEGGMAYSLRDPGVRARTWCLYGDLDDFLSRLGVADRSQVLAIVASPRGSVRAMAVGAPTAASVQAIDEALGGPSPGTP